MPQVHRILLPRGIGEKRCALTSASKPSSSDRTRKSDTTANNYPQDLICDRNEYFKTDAAFNYEMDKMEKDGICQVLHREDAFFTANTFCAYDKEILTHRDSHHLTQAGALYSISSCIERIRSILNTKQTLNFTFSASIQPCRRVAAIPR